MAATEGTDCCSRRERLEGLAGEAADKLERLRTVAAPNLDLAEHAAVGRLITQLRAMAPKAAAEAR